MKHLRCSNAQRSPAFLARGCFFSCNTWHCKSCWSSQLLLRGSNDVFVIFVCKDNPKLACSITFGLFFFPMLSCCLLRLLRDCGPRCWPCHIRSRCWLGFGQSSMYPIVACWLTFLHNLEQCESDPFIRESSGSIDVPIIVNDAFLPEKVQICFCVSIHVNILQEVL